MQRDNARKVTLVQIFNDDDAAQTAVRKLKEAGIRESEIRVVSHDSPVAVENQNGESGIVDRAKVGASVGVCIGVLWGLAVLHTVVPELNPAHAQSVIAMLFYCLELSVTAIGTAGALIGLGVLYETVAQFRAKLQRTIVIVKAGARSNIASRVLDRLNQSHSELPAASLPGVLPFPTRVHEYSFILQPKATPTCQFRYPRLYCPIRQSASQNPSGDLRRLRSMSPRFHLRSTFWRT